MQQPLTYLALGDSYTIGELVSENENFPNLVCYQMNLKGIAMDSPRIIAKTGWTTDELQAGILEENNKEPLLKKYDFVSLLIGVNNQYRSRSIHEYHADFETLLKNTLQFAGGESGNVVVVSIPDWGVTPFAEGRDRKAIANEIDQFNDANRQLAEKYHIHYIYITDWTREAASDLSLLTTDGLHPSGKEYLRWAQQIATYFQSVL